MELLQVKPITTSPRALGATAALTAHWPEYLMEAWGLGSFMVSACVFTVALEHPHSPLRQALPDDFVRHALGGIAMGLTAIGIIYSRWGKRSGAHINPAVTLASWGLGKISPWDAVFYAAAQFAGGLAGVLLSLAAFGEALRVPAANYVVTTPGAAGLLTAFAAETAISFGVMLTVLIVSNAKRLSPYTGLIVGCLVALYITFEAPLSGMSMNPARTLGSALPAGNFHALWVYFAAPALGMGSAAALYSALGGAGRVLCAKLHHDNNQRCIFRCRFSGSED